jgi:Chromo (CHRromatin Organisation MOdifier) domain
LPQAHNITGLAIADTLPEVFVHITTLWEIEKVVGKRYNEALQHYQYMVKYKGWSSYCNSWKNPEDIPYIDMVREYEEKRQDQIK